MRISVSWSVTLDDKERVDLIYYARALGYDFDNPPTHKLLKRVLEAHGKDAIVRAADHRRETNAVPELLEEAEGKTGR